MSAHKIFGALNFLFFLADMLGKSCISPSIQNISQKLCCVLEMGSRVDIDTKGQFWEIGPESRWIFADPGSYNTAPHVNL